MVKVSGRVREVEKSGVLFCQSLSRAFLGELIHFAVVKCLEFGRGHLREFDRVRLSCSHLFWLARAQPSDIVPRSGWPGTSPPEDISDGRGIELRRGEFQSFDPPLCRRSARP